MPNYVVVNPATKKILAGPFLWDPSSQAAWVAPVAGTVMLESDAASGGYTATAPPADPVGTLRAKIPAAIASNNAFMALPSPTNPQTLLQVQRMTRQLNALGRLVANLLEDTSDS